MRKGQQFSYKIDPQLICPFHFPPAETPLASCLPPRMAPLRLAALVALCLFVPSLVSASELQGRRFTLEEAIAETGAIYNEQKGRFAWWNETVEDPLAEEHAERRTTLALGDSSPVTVTFYESPGMYCSDGENGHRF